MFQGNKVVASNNGVIKQKKIVNEISNANNSNTGERLLLYALL